MQNMSISTTHEKIFNNSEVAYYLLAKPIFQLSCLHPFQFEQIAIELGRIT
jgi:hypothetical protein